MEFLERINGLTHSAVKRLHVRSALNPMLWLSGITLPLCFTFAYVFRDIESLRNNLVVAGLIPMGVTCIGFMGFAIFKPDKLQSEDYQIRHESLQIIQQKSGQMEISTTSLEAIANPAVPQLPSGRSK